MNLNFDDRQKKMLMIAGAVLAVIMFLWVIVLPRLGIGGIDAKIEAKEKELREMTRLYGNFEQVKRDFTRIDTQITRNSELSLQSELSAIAERLNIKQGVDSIISKARPKNDFYQEESVEIRLQKVTLEELTRLLYEIEQSPKVLRVRKLHIEGRFDDANLLNVVMEVSTFKRLEA